MGTRVATPPEDSPFDIFQGREWGWWLGVVMAGGAFLAYIESRTLGLPGLASLVVEAIFVGIAAYVLIQRSQVVQDPF